ncbi:MAG: hypothetical protein ABI760_03180 [Ferruginibacter sp.]
MSTKYIVCSILFLFTAGLSVAQVNTPVNKLSKTQVTTFNKSEADYLQVQKDLQKLEQQKKQLLVLMQDFDEQQKKVTTKVERLEKSYNDLGGVSETAGGNSQYQLLYATKLMQETQMSSNAQYLQMQMQMNREGHVFTSVSNVLKTRHDTVKNSISNVR